MRQLDSEEVARVVRYSFLNDYEPDECINLLNSKGQHSETYESVERRYEAMS